MYFNEKELLEKHRRQFFQLQKFLGEKNIDIDEFCDLLPGFLHLNRVNSIQLVYLDKTTRERAEIPKDKVETSGLKVLERALHPSCINYLKQVNEAADFSDPTFVLNTFQSISFDPIEVIKKNKQQYNLCFSSKKRFSDDLTISITQPLNELGKVYSQLEKVVEENLFLKRNFKRFDLLTRREKEIMRLISQGQTSQQVAEQLNISAHTVSTHRKNIWHKLEIKSYAELIRFAECFDLL